jgi:hypothetical protein
MMNHETLKRLTIWNNESNRHTTTVLVDGKLLLERKTNGQKQKKN